MSSPNEELSDSNSDSDDDLSGDMEALRRACQLAGKSPDHQLQLSSTPPAANGGVSSEAESEGEGEDDLRLVQCIQKRFAFPTDMEDEPLTTKPLCTLPPDWSDSDDCEDDYETLRAIQRRFAAYNDDGLKDNVRDSLHRPVQVGATIIDSEKETSNNFVERTNAREGFLNCVDKSDPETKSEACDDAGGRQPSDLVEWDRPGDDNVTGLPFKTFHFPKSAVAFVDAIKKNRSSQKLIRSKMMQMEARIEELNKLIERVKILKDFQVTCKKRTGRALSQKKDARIELISVPKLRAKMKLNEKKTPALYKGPPENLHVANYKEAMATFAICDSSEKWSKEERENLVKGVKQQFQGMLLQRSVDLLSGADGSYNSGNVDNILKSIKDINITPEKLRLFLPKVNWEQLASMYAPGRSGAECQARFLNYEDPLISHNPWTTVEDKNLLHIIQQKGLSDWIDIAASLGTNRTPFQCLARYQRSLNASILKREWTKEEDNQLRAAVEAYGESNWQVVASVMEGRTGTQCSNRWLKTLHPARKRVGKWTADEDKRLKVAVTLFGPKTWKKIAGCVPGRTQVQCRERWVNCLDPSLNMAEWTEEEDLKLEEAIAEHCYCWSKVAACIPRRTDNQCWRRWKVLFPNEVTQLQSARKIQKVALISNFVDRESERPALGPNDFRVPETFRITGSENVDPSRRKRTRSRRRKVNNYNEEDAHSSETSSKEVSMSPNGSELEISNGEEIRRSHVNDGNSKGKSLSKRKRSDFSDATTSGALESIQPITEDYKLSDPTASAILEEVPMELEHGGDYATQSDGNNKGKSRSKRKKLGLKPDFSDATTSGALESTQPITEDYTHSDPTASAILEEVPMELKHGGDYATQSRKARKLRPRRRHSKTLDEVPESVSHVDTLAMTTKKMKEKKQTGPTNDTLSAFHDSIPAMGSHEGTETEDAIALSETEDEGITLASFLEQLGADRTPLSSEEFASSQGKNNQCLQLKRRRKGDGTCLDRMMEVEVGDDITLAQFCDRLKRRRTEASQCL